MPCRLKIVSVTMAPEKKKATSRAPLVMIGSNALRNACRNMTLCSESPLARAVLT